MNKFSTSFLFWVKTCDLEEPWRFHLFLDNRWTIIHRLSPSCILVVSERIVRPNNKHHVIANATHGKCNYYSTKLKCNIISSNLVHIITFFKGYVIFYVENVKLEARHILPKLMVFSQLTPHQFCVFLLSWKVRIHTWTY